MESIVVQLLLTFVNPMARFVATVWSRATDTYQTNHSHILNDVIDLIVTVIVTGHGTAQPNAPRICALPANVRNVEPGEMNMLEIVCLSLKITVDNSSADVIVMATGIVRKNLLVYVKLLINTFGNSMYLFFYK